MIFYSVVALFCHLPLCRPSCRALCNFHRPIFKKGLNSNLCWGFRIIGRYKNVSIPWSTYLSLCPKSPSAHSKLGSAWPLGTCGNNWNEITLFFYLRYLRPMILMTCYLSFCCAAKDWSKIEDLHLSFKWFQMLKVATVSKNTFLQPFLQD